MRKVHVGAIVYGAAAAFALAVGVGLVMGAAPSGSHSAPEGLQALPWAHQPDGSPSIDAVGAQASIEFPPGVTHAEALQKLYVAVLEDNRLPDGAVLRDPLPAEVAVVTPDSGLRGVRVSLTAPFGWTSDTRRIRPPSFALPGHLSPDEVEKRVADALASGSALPVGATVDVPALESCQKAVGTAERRPACP